MAMNTGNICLKVKQVCTCQADGDKLAACHGLGECISKAGVVAMTWDNSDEPLQEIQSLVAASLSGI